MATFNVTVAEPLASAPTGFSATTVTRLLKTWQDDYQAWRKRSLKGKEYVYIWADGVYFNIRLEEDRLACLVLVGVLGFSKLRGPRDSPGGSPA